MTMPPLPEPVVRSQWLEWDDKSSTYEAFYTAGQMRAYGEACAAAERERAAKIVEDMNIGGSYRIRYTLAAAIRAQGDAP